MWLGEQITERGIGNGISLVISVGILARLPQAVQALADMFRSIDGADARFNFFHAIVMLCLLFGVIAGVIAVTQAQRKVRFNTLSEQSVGRLLLVVHHSCRCG